VRVVALWGLAVWVGATLLLAEVRRFSRVSLVERLRPYVVGGSTAAASLSPFSVESFRELVAPLAQEVGARGARFFGVREEAAVRLARIHSELDVTAFRLRQLGWSLLALAVALPAVVVLGPAPPLAVACCGAAPLLGFLVPEQQLATASSRWQQRLLLELPVVSEQVGMLLGAGYSLGSALTRLAARGDGVCARDLRRVTGRVRQGVPLDAALREWAGLACVPALDRVVAVLALDRETGDLGRLISVEARAVRQEVQRQAVALMGRRAQQVWVPVTVATLVPGVIFLSIPFVEALRLFSGS
jgi:tight adherence protein C